MEILVHPSGYLTADNRQFRCALGRTGVTIDKREGDGATPIGSFPLRRLLFRPDRLDPPETKLPTQPIDQMDGWCDDPADPLYNRPVRLPFEASCEEIWRADHLYDLVVVLGHNDDPVEPGRGSAIFLHCAKPDYGPTEGCLALARKDLLTLIAAIGPADRLIVEAR